MSVCCECCLLSGRSLCDGLITRPEQSYRLWRVVVCDQEISKTRRLKVRYWAVENTNTMGCNARKTNKQSQQTAFTFTSAISMWYTNADNNQSYIGFIFYYVFRLSVNPSSGN
jgi:hypothetical protein